MSNGSRPSIRLCLISVKVSYFWNTHTHTHIDESCLQANWNLDMDYSCLVDEPGESLNYEFQTSWPRCMVYNTSLFDRCRGEKCCLLCLDFLCAMHVKMHTFRFQLSTNDSYPVQIMHNVNFCDWNNVFFPISIFVGPWTTSGYVTLHFNYSGFFTHLTGFSSNITNNCYLIN